MKVPSNISDLSTFNKGRRTFIQHLTKSAGLTLLMASPVVSLAHKFLDNGKPVTVGEVMDLFLKEVKGAPFGQTVDTLKSGNRSQVVTGIVTTMFATVEVIRKAIDQKANLIIAHEPTFYNHADETNWLEKDEVYKYKADILQKHSIAVWRCHDYLHSHRPDGVQSGLIRALGWEQYADTANPSHVTMPSMSLKELITHAKLKLGISTVRYEGDLSQACRRLLLLPGAAGGRRQIQAISEFQPDLVLCGELSEWETAEYIRDARATGQKISLVILGHAVSEEPGLEWMATWLKQALPGMNVIHIPSRNPLSFV